MKWWDSMTRSGGGGRHKMGGWRHGGRGCRPVQAGVLSACLWGPVLWVGLSGGIPWVRGAAGDGVPAGPVFYVAVGGNDGWSGRAPELRPGTTDGPFATLPRALSAVREARRTGALASNTPARIVLRGGTYFLAEPVVLTPEDSHLEIAAFGTERPVLSAGRPVSGWQVMVRGGEVWWETQLPEVRGAAGPYRQLWVNGRRAVRARHPDRGYLPVAGVPDPTPRWHDGQRRFQCRAGDVPAGPTLTNAEAVVMNRWTDSHLPIVGWDGATRILSFGKRSVYQLEPGDLYYLEGAREFWDAPGEWWLELDTGRLFYRPRAGEDPVRASAVVANGPVVLRVEGQPERNAYVENVRFTGLTFSHTEWWFPADAETARRLAMSWPAPAHEVGGFGQAAVGVPAAVQAVGLHGSRFERCRFVHLGTYGLELGRGCVSNRVLQCEFADLGAGGIKIGETIIRTDWRDVARANEVADCHLHDGGRIFHSAVAVWIGQSPDNRLVHNHIHDFYYTGISVGWTWGYDPRALATNQWVAWNHVHHIGVQSDGDGPILSDMGGIYTLGRQVGTRIVNNLWHDIAGVRYGGWGIYFDEGTQGALAESNLVYRTTHGGFHQHYGATNVVRNNIFAFGRDHQLQRTRDEDHISFIFTNNLVVFDQGTVLGGSWRNDRFVMDGNLYWDLRPGARWDEPRFGGVSWEQWRARGHDRHSLIGDPLFVAPRAGDFRLRSGSPARLIGFQPLVLDGVGPRRSPPTD
ncbi:right-handed parallel beta-helix repeat-containing protein [Limisphaera ngatamarikiensis]|uniref:Right-handed parallel beta-helix repeat-containing protein n=1 Tax=Limisphaera ngatamarikiensis TaxID=1324935 RepID=A0A6M1S5G4_9BACT|nr:right-handed parallel beta-helix repeat-containing protein [Limisphaera ngatamarikiensis]NGO40490.1 right-handed parallel beta-helix repeat-containing protein [Limisphaera ngatamarikiensis]